MTLCDSYRQQETGVIHERDLVCVGVGSVRFSGLMLWWELEVRQCATDAQCRKSFGQFLWHVGQQNRRAPLSITLSSGVFWLWIRRSFLLLVSGQWPLLFRSRFWGLSRQTKSPGKETTVGQQQLWPSVTLKTLRWTKAFWPNVPFTPKRIMILGQCERIQYW